MGTLCPEKWSLPPVKESPQARKVSLVEPGLEGGAPEGRAGVRGSQLGGFAFSIPTREGRDLNLTNGNSKVGKAEAPSENV